MLHFAVYLREGSHGEHIARKRLAQILPAKAVLPGASFAPSDLQPTRLDGKPIDLETSLKRNWTFGVVGALLIDLPYVGWLMIPIDYPTEPSIPSPGSASMRMDRARRQKNRNLPRQS